ncbi:MAG: glycosyltransferase family 39 protein [Proteobacteria bacterium]|nr:glycosyltransferase family 39 protein [Pseudomonadota bacterium]
MSDSREWLPAAFWVVGAITLFRIAALWFDRTDLFVDESQYWLWGQNLDFGYYSKPPLIGWVIRAVTELAGSDAAFWVRLPGAVFHAATALILGALAAQISGGRVAVWVAAAYITLPFVALGSLLISTDTIMAPFFAAALLFHFRAVETRRAGEAALAGLCIGLAFLAKYAAVYFLLGAALAAVTAPEARLSARQWLAMLAAFALTIAPNVIWNLTHDLTTVEHTMDNVGWVRGGSAFAGLNPAGLAEFFFAQFAVFGPVLFGALLWGWLRGGVSARAALTAFSLPPLVIVCGQALMSRAYANWAVATYFTGLLIAVPLLLNRARRLLWASFAVNGAICLVLPVLTVLAPWPVVRGEPLLARYIGQSQLSGEIIAAAKEAGVATVVAADRGVLADLFYTGRDSGLAFRVPQSGGRADSYYEQTYPLPAGAGQVLYVGGTAPVCGAVAAQPQITFGTEGGTYSGRALAGYLVDGDCLDVAQ